MGVQTQSYTHPPLAHLLAHPPTRPDSHTLLESRLQTMKMMRFQYSRMTHDDDNSAAKRRARMELMSLFDPVRMRGWVGGGRAG